MPDNTNFPVLFNFKIECLKTGKNRQDSTIQRRYKITKCTWHNKLQNAEK